MNTNSLTEAYSANNDLPELPANDVGRTFDLLHKPGYAVELRVFGARRGNIASGYYDKRDAFVRDVLQQDGTKGDTCYATLNPVHPDLLARSYNTLNRCDGTADKDVERFRMLLMDFDPKRPTGIPSTDDEKRAACDRLLDARTYLLGRGFPEPIIADSGNGYHLLFRVDLPTDDVSLVRRFLESLNEQFGDEIVGIDTSVHNPARITKVYGTTPRNKGTGTADRPVRPSKLLDVPDELRTVGRDLLLSVASEEEPQPTRDEPRGYVLRSGGKFDVEAFIERHRINVLKKDTWNGPNDWHDSKKWIVECPWNGHTDNACHIIQNPEGVLSARCKHDSCQGFDWRDFREYYEPGSETRESTYTAPSSLQMTVGKNRKPRKGLLAGAVPLGEMMRNGIEAPDELIEDLLLEGRVHQVFCGPGKGKSWLALWIAVEVINRDLRVLYLDKENGPRIIRNRLVELGADPTKVDEYLVYVPFPSLDLEPDAVEDYVNSLDSFSLVIFDSWINYLAAAGLDENSNGDLARWSTTLCAEARKRNISVLLLDHVGKDAGNGSRGASRKLDEMDVAWELRTLIEFDREHKGMIQLRCKKDRGAWFPFNVEFEIGGDPSVLRRVRGFEVEEPDSLKNTLAAIEGFGADGAKYGAWMEATNKRRTGRTQFTEARKTLLEDGRVVQTGNLYHAAPFSPGAQPDNPFEDLVRDPEPDQAGPDEQSAENHVRMGEKGSGGGTGLNMESSLQSSPVRDPTLGGSRAGLVGPKDRGETYKPTVDQVADALLAMGADLDRHPVNLYADLIEGGYPHFKSTLIKEAIEYLRTAA